MTGSRLGRIGAVARHDMRILRRDPVFLVIFTVMPIGFMAFTKGAFGPALALRYPGQQINGAAQVVPGAAVLFSGFDIGTLRGKPISQEKEGMIHFIGLLLLFGLIIFLTFNDVSNLLNGTFK